MSSGRRPPRDLADLVGRFAAAVEARFGAPVYARRLGRPGELESDWPVDVAPLAEFDLQAGGLLELNASLRGRLNQVVDRLREAWDGGPRLSDAEVVEAKDALTSLLHEIVHALGPDDPEVAATDWWTAHRYPHASVATEGLAELAARLFIEDVLSATGLSDLEPRLRSAPLRERPYPGPEAAMRTLVGGIASRTRRLVVADPGRPELTTDDQRLRAEVAEMITEGTGDRPMAQLVHRLLRAESLDLLPRPQYPAAFAAVIGRLDAALDQVAARQLRGDADGASQVAAGADADIADYISRAQRRLAPYAASAPPPPRSFRALAEPVRPGPDRLALSERDIG